METTYRYLSCLLLVLFWQNTAQAQPPYTACNGVTAPEMTANSSAFAVATNALTPAPSFDVAGAGLPNTEFFITAKNQLSVDGLGDKIIGTDVDGQVRPSDYGLGQGDEFEITPINFDLIQLQTLVDDLLNGTGCCSLLELVSTGFCDSLNSAGINSGADVQSLDQVLNLFLIINGDTDLSIEGFEGSVRTTINNTTIISLLSGGCGGGGLPLCYGIHPGKRAYYRADNLAQMEELRLFGEAKVFPNPASSAGFTLQLELPQPRELHLGLSNSLGQEVWQRALGQVQGAQQWQIETAALPAGWYVLRLTDGERAQSLPLRID